MSMTVFMHYCARVYFIDFLIKFAVCGAVIRKRQMQSISRGAPQRFLKTCVLSKLAT